MSEVKVNKISPRTNCGTVTVGDSGDSVSVTAGVPVTVNGDLKSNALKATDGGSIISQSGTTITLGASGDTVSLASGASQSGFGREGSVDWQTTIKTGDFTAVSGEGYFINTTSGAITMTLPSSPSAGDIVAIKDYANTFDTNKLTINRNGSSISGDAVNPEITTEGQALTLVYGDATKGWQSVAAATESDLPKPQFIAATGGTITTVCTNFKVHTFTGPGTFCVSNAGNAAGSNKVSYIVVAGGGGGGSVVSAGGGGGGFREGKSADAGYTASPLVAPDGLTVTATGFPITVGGAGTGGTVPDTFGNAGKGGNSIFSTITSTGGGGAGNDQGTGQPGGSGGGRLRNTVGAGNTPPVSPPQGNPGGCGSTSGSHFAGGGGGATAAGAAGAAPAAGGNGGAGATTNINGSPKSFSGGGGGSSTVNTGQTGTLGNGGVGGGGGASMQGSNPTGSNGGVGFNNGADGNPGTSNTGGAGGTNSGGGGGGGAHGSGPGGAGGSGIVIIRYKFQ